MGRFTYLIHNAMQWMEGGTTIATFYTRNISKRGLFGAFGQNSTLHQHFSLFHVMYHSVIITLEDKFFGGPTTQAGV